MYPCKKSKNRTLPIAKARAHAFVARPTIEIHDEVGSMYLCVSILIDSFSLLNFSNTVSTRKYASGSEKKRKRVDGLIESQRGAMDRFALYF
jgi:hypothetical protein